MSFHAKWVEIMIQMEIMEIAVWHGNELREVINMIRKRNGKCILNVLAVATVVCSICGGCGSQSNVNPPENTVVEDTVPADGAEPAEVQTDDTETSDTQQTSEAPVVQEDTQAGEDLDVVEPDAADDKWYMQGNVYTDDNGRRLEVYYDDEGMLEFAIDGLSMYYTTVDNYQLENDWRIYTCDDGTVIIYYPGTPAHLEISDGEYAGLYQADGGI